MLSSGLPSSPPYVGSMGIGPSGDGSSIPGNHERPFMANVLSKGQRMNARTVVLISFCSFILFLMCVGILCTILKFKRLGRPSSTIGPTVASSITKRSGKNMYELC